MHAEPCFIIAEIGVNHNGDIESALKLIDIAAEIGANAAKFQTFDAAKLVRPEAATADYQRLQTGDGKQKAMLEALQLSEADHLLLTERCRQRGIEFMSTPFDLDAADFLKSVGVRRMKLPSGDINNVPMIRRMAALDMPVIMSTGMAEMMEVSFAKACIEQEWSRLSLMQDRADRLVILHCTSNYPAEPADVNLDAMTAMARELDCPVGYSDHTLGSAIAIAAVAKGAIVIEKHITLDKNLPGPDHAASLDPVEFASMVRQIRAVEAARGDGVKTPQPSELPVRELVRRSISLAADLARGDIVSADDLICLRPANGIPPNRFDDIVGREVTRDLEAGTLLSWDDLN